MDNGIQSAGDMAMMQATATNMSAKLPSGGNVDKASQDFEGMFMTQMLQPMFEGLDVDPIFGGGNGEQVMRSFLIQEYGKIIAKSGHIGIASAVKKEMIEAQAAQQAAHKGGSNAITQ
jgi:Rod binding domain-containing protein